MAVDWGRHGQCGLAVGCPSSAVRYSMFIAIGIFLKAVFKLNIILFFLLYRCFTKNFVEISMVNRITIIKCNKKRYN